MEVKYKKNYIPLTLPLRRYLIHDIHDVVVRLIEINLTLSRKGCLHVRPVTKNHVLYIPCILQRSINLDTKIRQKTYLIVKKFHIHVINYKNITN